MAERELVGADGRPHVHDFIPLTDPAGVFLGVRLCVCGTFIDDREANDG